MNSTKPMKLNTHLPQSKVQIFDDNDDANSNDVDELTSHIQQKPLIHKQSSLENRPPSFCLDRHSNFSNLTSTFPEVNNRASGFFNQSSTFQDPNKIILLDENGEQLQGSRSSFIKPLGYRTSMSFKPCIDIDKIEIDLKSVIESNHSEKGQSVQSFQYATSNLRKREEKKVDSGCCVIL